MLLSWNYIGALVGESSEETFDDKLSNNAEAAEKIQPIVVAVSERDLLRHIQPYLCRSVYDSSMYDSINAEVNGEIIAHQGPHWDVQNCVQTYLTHLTSWFGKQGRAVLVLGHSIRSNPPMINAEYPNTKLWFFSDTSIT